MSDTFRSAFDRQCQIVHGWKVEAVKILNISNTGARYQSSIVQQFSNPEAIQWYRHLPRDRYPIPSRPSPRMARNVFISYRHDDEEIMRRFAQCVQRSGHKSMTDGQIPVGEIWNKELAQMISQCDIMIVLIGMRGLSEYQDLEIGHFQKQLAGRKIIPVMLPDASSTIPDILSPIQAASLKYGFSDADVSAIVATI